MKRLFNYEVIFNTRAGKLTFITTIVAENPSESVDILKKVLDAGGYPQPVISDGDVVHMIEAVWQRPQANEPDTHPFLREEEE